MITNYHPRWLGKSHFLTSRSSNTFCKLLLLMMILAFSTMNAQNETCATAVSATVTPNGDTSQPIDFDTTGLPDANVVPSCEGVDTGESDLWYSFTTNATGGVTLSLLSGDEDNLEGAVYDACGGTELFCFSDGSSVDFSSDVLVTGLAPNTTYFLQVYTEDFSEGAFSLAITDLPACPEPQNLNVTNITTDSADLNWGDVTEATLGYEYSVYFAGDDPTDPNVTPVVAPTSVNAGETSVNVTGLTPQTDYDFYISSDCDADGTSNLAGPESFSTLALPPANDDVCDAIPLTVGAISAGDAFTNLGATEETDEPIAGCFNNGIDGSVWFTFDAPASGEVSVTTDILGGTLTDTEVAVYDAPTDCTDLTTLGAELGCNQDGGEDVNFNSIVDLTGLTPGTTYYVQVDQWGSTTPGTFGIRVLDTNPPCPEPANLNADNITTTSADLNWSDVTEATLGYEYSVYFAGDDPTDTNITPVVAPTQVNAGDTSVNVTGLTPQTDYEFYVSSDCDADGTSILAGPASFTTLPENDECSDALPATVTAFGDTSQPIDFDTTGAQDATVIPSCEGTDSGESDLWYSFTTNATGGVTLSLLSGDEDDLEGAVYDACGGAELFCFADGSGVDFSSDVLVTGLAPNTTYFLQVYTEDFSEGAFSLAINDLPGCPEPQNLNVTNITSDSADLNWGDVTEATLGYEYSVYFAGDDPTDPNVTPVVAPTSVNAGETSVNVTGLTPQTDYDFYVKSDCDADGTSDLAGPESFSTLPENDECSDALPATVTAFGDTSQPIDFDTTGAQDATVIPSCEGVDSGESDLWYSFTTNATGGVTLSLLSGDEDDLEGAVYDACGGTELFCFSDGSSVDFSSDVLVTGLAPNTTYFLQVYTEDFSEGAFSLAITDLPACPEPQNLNVTNITTDSADLNWGDVTEATLGYEYSVYFAGDDPTDPNVTPVVTPTSVNAGETSVNVTGLTPQTDYDFYVKSDCDADGTSDLAGPESFSTLALPPDNDDVCDAITLTVGATPAGDAFTNVGATAQPDEPISPNQSEGGLSCINDGINGSVWFTFVAPASGSVEVSTDIVGGTLTDTEMVVFEAPTDCTDLTTLGAELGCDQDGGVDVPLNSVVNLSGLTPGDTYYVQVDQWGTTTPGTFGIEVQENLSTESFSDDNFSFYPNPTENRLNLQTTGQVETVKVYNMLGQEVMKETPNTVSPSLNVQALQAGNYIMNVTIDGITANFRFIKK